MRQPPKSTGKQGQGTELFQHHTPAICRQCPLQSFKKVKMDIQSKVILNTTLLISQSLKSTLILLWFRRDLGQPPGNSTKWKSKVARIINIDLRAVPGRSS